MKNHNSIVEITCKYIRSKIANGEIRLNEKVSMRKIAEDLEISRTPIREAIRKLESEGLIELLPRRGFIVKKYNPKQVEEIYVARQILEVSAVRLACDRIKKKDLERLKKINDNLSKVLIEGKKDILKIKKLNEDFHFTLYKNSGNDVICEIIQNLWNRISGLFIQLFKNPKQGKTTFQEHNEIIQALENQDVNKSTEMIDNHLSANKKQLMSFIKQE